MWNIGTLPDILVDKNGLITFNVASNLLHGSIPPGLVRGKGLQDVDLSRNFLSGDIPSGLSPTMDNLNLLENALDGTFPVDLCTVPCELNTLKLNHNLLHGELPYSLSNVNRLGTLDISYNSLSGTIPESILALTRLRDFGLTGNSFSGSLDRLLTMERVSTLSASLNAFTGPLTFPADMNYDTMYINVSFNFLSGPFTIEYTEMGTMSYIDVSDNFLTGPIPVNISLVRQTALVFFPLIFVACDSFLMLNVYHS
jgi:hypothetical protein